MTRLSFEQATEIIKSMGKTFEVRPLEHRDGGNRYALVSTANNKVTDLIYFKNGFQVVHFAKYIEEEKPKSMKQALVVNTEQWWVEREKAQAAEYFREKNRALRIPSSLDEEV